MNRMHFTNAKLNPRVQVVAWNSGPFTFCNYGI
jgi:hypothetical protein